MAELVIEQTLRGFLDAYRLKPWAPGRVDCCMSLAAWAIWLGHRDPAEHLRGTYDSAEGFRAITETSGGLVSLVSGCVDKIGGKGLREPRCGAVGVIGSKRNIHRQWGAIFDGSQWLIRAKEGIAPLVASPLAIWEI